MQTVCHSIKHFEFNGFLIRATVWHYLADVHDWSRIISDDQNAACNTAVLYEPDDVCKANEIANVEYDDKQNTDYVGREIRVQRDFQTRMYDRQEFE